MNAYTFTCEKGTLKRITKTAARRAYLDGLPVVITPCNMRPVDSWGGMITLDRKYREHMVLDETGAANDFINLVNSFEYYNCTNKKVGKYSAFYVFVV